MITARKTNLKRIEANLMRNCFGLALPFFFLWKNNSGVILKANNFPAHFVKPLVTESEMKMFRIE